MVVEISRDSVSPGETESCWKPRCPLKVTAFKLLLASTHPGLQWKIVAQRILKANRERLELYGFGERAGGTANNVPVLSSFLPPPMEAIFPWLSTHLTWPQSGEMHWPHTDYSQRPILPSSYTALGSASGC